MARLTLDSEKCTGHGRCYTLSPTLFGADDGGYAEMLTDGIDPDPAAAQLAVDGCPENAITLAD